MSDIIKAPDHILETGKRQQQQHHHHHHHHHQHIVTVIPTKQVYGALMFGLNIRSGQVMTQNNYKLRVINATSIDKWFICRYSLIGKTKLQALQHKNKYPPALVPLYVSVDVGFTIPPFIHANNKADHHNQRSTYKK